uniref:Uncharacterized protein n=1 Tax=Panagrellus redivivus TaxID=6233 RepID=A0A7E4UPY3_PANRE
MKTLLKVQKPPKSLHLQCETPFPLLDTLQKPLTSCRPIDGYRDDLDWPHLTETDRYITVELPSLAFPRSVPFPAAVPLALCMALSRMPQASGTVPVPTPSDRIVVLIFSRRNIILSPLSQVYRETMQPVSMYPCIGGRLRQKAPLPWFHSHNISLKHAF